MQGGVAERRRREAIGKAKAMIATEATGITEGAACGRADIAPSAPPRLCGVLFATAKR